MDQRTPVTIITDDSDPIIGTERSANIDTGRKSEPARDVPKIAGFDVIDPGEFIDGGTADGDRSTASAGKRRGRPPGSRNKQSATTGNTQEKAPQNIAENLERLLLSTHLMGAAMLKCPELELDVDEAKKLASAIREVSKHYPVVFDPKKMALMELGTVALMVYGTRGVAIYKRIQRESQPQPPRQQPVNIDTRKQRPATPGAPAPQPAQPAQPAPRAQTMPSTPFEIWGGDNGVVDSSNL